MSIMVCFNWFNPLCYKLHQNLREWSEAACDSRVCRQGAAEFSPKEYLYLVITCCRPARVNRNYFTRSINENGNVESFKDRIDRLFVTMDTWEAGGWRHWIEPALYMMSAIILSFFLVYGVAVVRDYAVRETETVVDLGAGKPLGEFIVKPSKVDNRPSKENAFLFPNEGTFKGDMKDGLVIYRLYPKEGMVALDISMHGDRGVYYEFGIFTEKGELFTENFWNKGSTILELEEEQTYYIYVRDKAKTTEDIVFMYYWRDQDWLKKYHFLNSER